MSVMPPHVLVIGGTGILSPAVRVLVDRGSRVSVVSRSGHGVPAGADAVVADVTRVEALAAALDRAIGERGPLGLALAYQPFAPAGAWAALAARVRGPLVALLTSGHAAPLDAPAPPLPAGASWAVEGTEGSEESGGAEVRHLLLGWHPRGAGLPARWHTPREISAATLQVAGVVFSAADLGAADTVSPAADLKGSDTVSSATDLGAADTVSSSAELRDPDTLSSAAESGGADAVFPAAGPGGAGAAGEDAGGPASGMGAPADLAVPGKSGESGEPGEPGLPGRLGKPAVLGVVRPWDGRPEG
ncbi:hypothetical protein [Streptosporangium sp. NPDC002721]|uniref:hypothetical protein n=1 Tax=Streptosporangium sp. NPDC002721 TaxID=3366188 RepID=UPI00369F862A